MSNEDGLLELRNQLDAIDNKLLDLIMKEWKLFTKLVL